MIINMSEINIDNVNDWEEKMMKIIDKSSPAPVTEYSVGDVIQDEDSVYMIVKTPTENYAEIDLKYGTSSGVCGSLEELYHKTHISFERKVKAALVIEGVREKNVEVTNSVKLREKLREEK